MCAWLLPVCHRMHVSSGSTMPLPHSSVPIIKNHSAALYVSTWLFICCLSHTISKAELSNRHFFDARRSESRMRSQENVSPLKINMPLTFLTSILGEVSLFTSLAASALPHSCLSSLPPYLVIIQHVFLLELLC